MGILLSSNSLEQPIGASDVIAAIQAIIHGMSEEVLDLQDLSQLSEPISLGGRARYWAERPSLSASP